MSSAAIPLTNLSSFGSASCRRRILNKSGYSKIRLCLMSVNFEAVSTAKLNKSNNYNILKNFNLPIADLCVDGASDRPILFGSSAYDRDYLEHFEDRRKNCVRKAASPKCFCVQIAALQRFPTPMILVKVSSLRLGLSYFSKNLNK